jgi:hypothetical protein
MNKIKLKKQGNGSKNGFLNQPLQGPAGDNARRFSEKKALIYGSGNISIEQ